MKYVQLGPKYLYYLGIIFPTLVFCFLAGLLGKFALQQQFDGLIITGIFSFFLLLRILYCIKKYIYAKVDTVSKVLLFGSILFENEIPLDKVKLQGSTWLFHTVIKIEISNRVYYINTLGGNIKEQFDSIK